MYVIKILNRNTPPRASVVHAISCFDCKYFNGGDVLNFLSSFVAVQCIFEDLITLKKKKSFTGCINNMWKECIESSDNRAKSSDNPFGKKEKKKEKK